MRKVPFGTPPPPSDPTYQVLRIKNGHKATVCLLAGLSWVRLHWIDGRTFPCQSRGVKALCRDKHHCWKGYAPAVYARTDEEGHSRWQRCVIEVAREADVDVPVGTPLVFKRSNHKPIGKLEVEIATRMTVDLPKPFAVDASLWKLWGQT